MESDNLTSLRELIDVNFDGYKLKDCTLDTAALELTRCASPPSSCLLPRVSHQ